MDQRGTDRLEMIVCNPRGEIPPPPVLGISPRLKDLDGKKIGLLDNNKKGSQNFLDAVEDLLKERHPAVDILRLKKPHDARVIFDAPEWYGDVADKVDAFVFATGD